ncbi:MAG: TRAP transporter substrate-binding protein [Bosea sp.]|nr:TRAP transporter substrate-binding protein [Bosea sp. (in: a-proteobacteria)]
MKRRDFLFTVPLLAALTAAPALAQDIQDRTIKFGYFVNAESPVGHGVRKFAEIVAAKSGGKLKVREFPAAQLGNENQQQSALIAGTQEMAAPGSPQLVGAVKEFGLLDFPYIVSTLPQADALLDGPFGQSLLKTLPAKGIVGLGYFENGFRHVTNSKRPIAKPEDLEGLKIRVIPNPVFLETFKSFKANPVPMPFAELYGALESKAVDGQENPYSVILSNKFFEVQKFVSATNHVYAANIVLVSKKFWDSLSAAEQKMMNEAADEARGYQRQVSRAAAQKAIGDLQAKGAQFNEVSAAEQVRMREIAKPAIDKFASQYDAGIVKLYNDELARIRKQ